MTLTTKQQHRLKLKGVTVVVGLFPQRPLDVILSWESYSLNNLLMTCSIVIVIQQTIKSSGLLKTSQSYDLKHNNRCNVTIVATIIYHSTQLYFQGCEIFYLQYTKCVISKNYKKQKDFMVFQETFRKTFNMKLFFLTLQGCILDTGIRVKRFWETKGNAPFPKKIIVVYAFATFMYAKKNLSHIQKSLTKCWGDKKNMKTNLMQKTWI